MNKQCKILKNFILMIESGISHTFACRSLSEHVINAGLYRAASLTVEVKTKRTKKFKL